jgi:APA family basic amino acid/polyamine antiporter
VAGEVRNPGRNLPPALAFGCRAVVSLCLLANLAYLSVLPLAAIQHAPSGRVATAMKEGVFPGYGPLLMAGPRAYYAKARDCWTERSPRP